MEILYIEDDLIDQIALKRLVRRKKGVVCRVANDIEEADVLIQKNAFDLILSDYYLAGDTVEDVLSRFTSLPIFLVSGSDDKNKIEGLYKNGLKGHFKKPISEQDLDQLLEKKTSTTSLEIALEVADFSKPISFDFTFLETVISNSLNLKKEFIQIFIKVAIEENEKIAGALKQNNYDVIGQSVHKLKSNFRMMGLTQLLLNADELEVLCFKEQQLDHIQIDHIQRDVVLFLARLGKTIVLAQLKLEDLNLKLKEHG